MGNSRSSLNRRGFLTSMAAMGMASLGRPSPGWAAPSAGKLRLGFDNFSIRAFDWKAPRLIDYAASLNVDILLLSDLEVYESLEPSYLKKIRAQAEEAGVALQVGTGSICPTSKSYNERKWGPAVDHARLLLKVARRLGSPVARCYLGSRRDRDGDGGIYRHIDETVKVLKAVRNEAEDANIKIAVENHAGDMQAWELVGLIEAAGKSYVGATMDPGNAVWTVEDPMVNLELLGPYVVTTGIRDTMVWETEEGAKAMWTNMGQGLTDWPAYVKRFQEHCPTDTFVLEIISYKWQGDMPYLTRDFWKRFPKARAREFARFVALAKRGSQFELPPGRPAGPESAQQKFDLEESIKYCREVLGIGVKG
ncbi:MAG: sugar phosphate isomerase/epimerase family protein [Planctomycetota bacterium]